MKRLDVDAMLEGLSATQLAEWEAFYTLEPWGADVDDHRAGIVAAAVANMAGKQMRKGKVAVPSDYFPSRLPKPRPDGLDVRAQVHAIFGPMARRKVRHGNDR